MGNDKLRDCLIVFFLFRFSLFISGCAYSFTGSSVPPHLKTIAVSLFDDQSGAGQPGLREQFRETLIAQFAGDNSLQVADKKDADSILEGVILAVRDEPLVVEKGETVSKRRVTIVVKAAYQDMKLRKKVWEKELSNWGAYEVGPGAEQKTKGIDELRKEGIDEAVRKLTEDILLATVSGW